MAAKDGGFQTDADRHSRHGVERKCEHNSDEHRGGGRELNQFA